MATQLQNIMDIERDKHAIAGVSLALYENGELTTAVSGEINVTTGVAMNVDTLMHIGSITKLFNATLVMQLVDEGLLELDRPVLDYIPELRTADMDALAKVTVAMLINHQSGIDGVIIADEGPDRERIADAIPRFASLGQVHEPGEAVSYCNVGCVIAGYLCERVKGRSWYTLVENQIFRPLGMDHAIVQPADALLHRASVGHYRDPATGAPARTSVPFLLHSFAPAGATAMMTATDLIGFARMHLNNGMGANGVRILSEESARLMREKTGTYGGPKQNSFGLGWQLLDPGFLSHGGGGPGIASYLLVHPDSDAALAILTNSAEGFSLIDVMTSDFLTRRGGSLLEMGPARAPNSKDMLAADASFDHEPFIGTYEGVSTLFVVELKDGELFFNITEKSAYYESMTTDMLSAPLWPMADGTFVIGPGIPGFSNRRVGFINPDEAGRMQHFAPGGSLYKRTAQ